MLSFQVTYKHINERIQYMKYHALILKFIDILSHQEGPNMVHPHEMKTSRALQYLTRRKWVFYSKVTCLQDGNRIFDHAPYFFNLWKEHFNSGKKYLSLLLSGFDYIHSYRSCRKKEHWKALVIFKSQTLLGQGVILLMLESTFI